MKPVLSSLVTVISNLEELGIYGLKEMKWLQGIIGNNVYLMHNIKELSFFGLSSIKSLYWFLHRFSNLESLNVRYSIINEVLPGRSDASFEKIGTVVQLKNMNLEFSDIPLNIGFENGTILQRVEKLCIEECLYTANIIPSSIELTHLSYLEVSNCNRLRNLLTPSTVKSLVQLTIMKVAQCAMVEEIVTVQENEEEKEDEIVFGKLKNIELMSLGNLTRFCNSQTKLVFRFPSLVKVKVSDCFKLEKFSERIMSTPNLEKVYVAEGEGGDKWYWEGDLNATIQKIFTDKVLFEFCQNLKLSYYPELQQLWRGEISPPENCFNNLRTLTIENLSFVSEVFPYWLLPYFTSLKELRVSRSLVAVIFDMDGNILTETNEKHFDLKRLTLNVLPNLECIWSKDPRSTSFRNLKEVVVTSCVRIKTLFPASLAINLVRLKKLRIGNCEKLEEIIGEEEAVADGASRKFEFHYLTTLSMYDLPSLKFFYPRRYTLECPNLESLHVRNCDKLDQFASDFQSHQRAVGCEDEANNTTSRQSLFTAEKVIPNLGNLTLNRKDVKMLSHGHFPSNLLHKLKFLELYAGATLPFKFFEKVPNLESLKISNFNSLEEMFPSQSPEDIDHIINILAQVRRLLLDSLPVLSSIGLDNSWMDPVVKNLRVLGISDCPLLTILVPSSAKSFCNLEELEITQCDGLVSLFSSSVAKSLVRVERMEISECESITQIVNHASSDDEIIFEMLRVIVLSRLPNLVSFYSGNATIEFSGYPFYAIIEQCPKMKCFSEGVVRATIFLGIIEGSADEVAWHNYGDPNTTVQKLFDVKLANFARNASKLMFYDHPELHKIWKGVTTVPDRGFNNLEALTVDRCQSLAHVIPSHLVLFLCNLKRLTVRSCNAVKAILDVDSMSSPFSSPLESIILEELPNLEQVWNDPQEILSFKSLQCVDVNGCRSLKSLFPASKVQCKLESLKILRVEHCEGLIEIVGTEETASEGATNNLTSFPNLNELMLCNLPELRCIYSGLNNVICPKLKKLDILQCGQLKNVIVVGSEDFAIITLEKVYPMIWQPSFPLKLRRRSKFLKLQGFGDDSDVFPCGFFGKESLPHVEKLAVSCSNFKQMFTSERSDLDGSADNFISQLKALELISLSKLISIGLEHTHLLGNLETLTVTECPCLINLAPSTVSFSNLKRLDVRSCDGLLCLFTPSTAKSLALLEELCVRGCKSMQELVVKGVDESDQDDEITFGNLKTLDLAFLPSLDSFYTGTCRLNFPYLKQVLIHSCNQMKVFSNADMYTPDDVTINSSHNLSDMLEKTFKKAT